MIKMKFLVLTALLLSTVAPSFADEPKPELPGWMREGKVIQARELAVVFQSIAYATCYATTKHA